MKTKILSLFVVIALLSFKPEDPKPVNMPLRDWAVYLRNVERLKAMAGRSVSSEILLSTIDTVNFYQKHLVDQLNKPSADTIQKK